MNIDSKQTIAQTTYSLKWYPRQIRHKKPINVHPDEILTWADISTWPSGSQPHLNPTIGHTLILGNTKYKHPRTRNNSNKCYDYFTSFPPKQPETGLWSCLLHNIVIQTLEFQIAYPGKTNIFTSHHTELNTLTTRYDKSTQTL